MKASSVLALLALSVGPAAGLLAKSQVDSKQDDVGPSKGKKDAPKWSENIEELAADSQKHLQKVRDNYNALLKKGPPKPQEPQALSDTWKALPQLQKKQEQQLKKAYDDSVKNFVKPQTQKDSKKDQKSSQKDQKNLVGKDMQKATKDYMNNLQKATKKAQKSSLAEGEAQVELEAEHPHPTGPHKSKVQSMMKKKENGHRDLPKHGQWDHLRRQKQAKDQQGMAYKKTLERVMNTQHHQKPAWLSGSWSTERQVSTHGR